MNQQYLKNVVEAALLAAGRPVSVAELVSLLDERDEVSKEDLQTALAALSEDYAERGIELREVASGWRVQIRSACAEPVARLWHERPPRYSRAFLETLALIAYRQPITRGEIEQIRGVAVNPNIIKGLLEREWIRVVGHREVPGRPELLGTTREFLDYFGLKKLEELPTLAELKEMQDLRVQLDLPGAERAARSVPADDAAPGALEAMADERAEDEDTAVAAPLEARTGLVARGPEDALEG
jgi:segregation and condensation protein B